MLKNNQDMENQINLLNEEIRTQISQMASAESINRNHEGQLQEALDEMEEAHREDLKVIEKSWKLKKLREKEIEYLNGKIDKMVEAETNYIINDKQLRDKMKQMIETDA